MQMRTVDVARRAGYSVQQVRNLERDGVLPPATRTATGYRIYAEVHLQSVLAYRALAAGVGPTEAKKIVRAVHHGPASQVLALLDAAHARLDAERTDLRQARQAAQAISSEPIEDVRASDLMSVSELAAALGVRPSTLPHWVPCSPSPPLTTPPLATAPQHPATLPRRNPHSHAPSPCRTDFLAGYKDSGCRVEMAAIARPTRRRCRAGPRAG